MPIAKTVPPPDRQACQCGCPTQAIKESTLRAVEAQSVRPCRTVGCTKAVTVDYNNGLCVECNDRLHGRAAAPAEAVIGTGPDADPKPLVVLPSGPKSLVHADGRQYDFHPHDGTVAVVMTGRYSFTRIEMPRAEALYLWNRLRRQGFEQF